MEPRSPKSEGLNPPPENPPNPPPPAPALAARWYSRNFFAFSSSNPWESATSPNSS